MVKHTHTQHMFIHCVCVWGQSSWAFSRVPSDNIGINALPSAKSSRNYTIFAELWFIDWKSNENRSLLFMSNVIPSYILLLTVDLCLFFFHFLGFAAAAAAADAIAPSTSVVVMQRNNTPTNRVKVRLLLQSNGSGGGGGLKAQVPASTCVNNTH